MNEQERLQLLERFGMDSKLWPERFNAIVEEILPCAPAWLIWK